MEGVADGTLEGDAMSASRSQSSEIVGGLGRGRSTIRTAMDTENRQMHADAEMQPKTTDAPSDG